MHVELRDAAFALTVTLDYRAHAEHDLTERWATVLNGGTDTLSLEQVWSAQWHVPGGDQDSGAVWKTPRLRLDLGDFRRTVRRSSRADPP